MFAPVAAFSIFSQSEGRKHAFIHHFLEVLGLLSRANEQNPFRRRVGNVLRLFLCVCRSVFEHRSSTQGTSFPLSVFLLFAAEFSRFSSPPGFS